MKTLLKDFSKGLWSENPVLVLLLGMCPTLATSSNASNALAMGLATTFVLFCSNIVISLIRDLVPEKIRIPVYIVVIATFVTVVDLLMNAYAPPAVFRALGIFLPLITVNCIVLGRAEAFASRHWVVHAAADGLGMGIGFTLALSVVGMIREFLAVGSVFDLHLGLWEEGFAVFGLAPGGFMVLGLILAGMNALNRRRARKAGHTYEAPQDFDCRHCSLCGAGKRVFPKQ